MSKEKKLIIEIVPDTGHNKPRLAVFHSKAREMVQTFPREIKKAAGELISELQHGAVLEMPHSRPIPEAGKGVSELRVRDGNTQYRLFYFTKSERGILIFHVFVKKTRKTSELEIRLGKIRLRDMLYEEEKR